MVDLVISPATTEDAGLMARLLHPLVKGSIVALGEGTDYESITRALSRSKLAWSGRVDNELMAMWGAAEIDDDVAYPWLYVSERISEKPKLTLTVARRVIDEMLMTYPRLFGTVDKEFPASVRFAERLGFVVAPSEASDRLLTIDKSRGPEWPI